MFLQCTNQQHTILPSFETPRGCFETSRNAPQTEQTLLISFFTAVLLSQAHQTECLIAIRHSWKPTHSEFHATRKSKTFSPYWLISLQLHGCTRKGHSTLGWTHAFMWRDNPMENQIILLAMNLAAQTNVEPHVKLKMLNCLKQGALNLLPDKTI